MSGYTIAPLARAQVVDYAATHVELLNTTYAHMVPLDYARLRRSELADRIGELLADLDDADAAAAAGAEPFRRHWIATGPTGAVVGVAASGEGVGDWERPALGDIWTPPATTFCLDHLYIAPGMQGSGLGQALLDVALPGGRAAYLWVIGGNDRAIRFYERNGFARDGLDTNTGPAWGNIPMSRMVRGPRSEASVSPSYS